MANLAATESFPYPQLDCDDTNKPLEIAQYLESRGVPYVFGGKWPADGDLDAVEGIDCSGEVSLAIFHMTGETVNLMADNSQMDGAWFDGQGYKRSTPIDADNQTGVLYAFVLPSSQSSDGIGHVGTMRNSATAESYGHHGPGSRPWGPMANGVPNPAWAWQQHCLVWVLHL